MPPSAKRPRPRLFHFVSCVPDRPCLAVVAVDVMLSGSVPQGGRNRVSRGRFAYAYIILPRPRESSKADAFPPGRACCSWQFLLFPQQFWLSVARLSRIVLSFLRDAQGPPSLPATCLGSISDQHEEMERRHGSQALRPYPDQCLGSATQPCRKQPQTP